MLRRCLFLNIKYFYMSVIYLTLIISTVVAVVFFLVFVISLNKGQFDDTYTPSVRMLFDDELVNTDETDLELKTENQKENNKQKSTNTQN